MGWQNSQSSSMGRTGKWGARVAHGFSALSLGALSPSCFRGPHSALDACLSPFPPLMEGKVGKDLPECLGTLNSGESMAETKQLWDLRRAPSAVSSTLLRWLIQHQREINSHAAFRNKLRGIFTDGENLFMRC